MSSVYARLLSFSCLLLLIEGCATGKPGTTYRNYSVYAETRTGFTRSVRATAPRGGRALSLVEITFHPDYKLAAKDNGCRATVKGVGLELVIVLPKWRDGKAVSGKVRRRWIRFERTVRNHEMAHVQIANTYAAKMRRAISALSFATGCTDPAGRIRTRIDQIKSRQLQAQKRFDARKEFDLKHCYKGHFLSRFRSHW